MSAVDEAGALLFVAREDANDALFLLGRGTSRNPSYLTSQAIEKLMKAVLKFKGIDHPATSHRLDQLLDHFPKGDDWIAQLEELTQFEAYATTYRYTDGGKIRQSAPEAEVRKAVGQVLALVEVACEEMGIRLGTREAPIIHL